MRRRTLPALLLAVGLSVSACTSGDDAVDVNNGGQFRFEEATAGGELIGADRRDSAPSFTGTLLDGGAFESSSLAGSVAVLNFWASWCGPCRTETPELQQLYLETRSSQVQFLGINVKDENQRARAFLDNRDIAFPSLYDPMGQVTLAFRDFPANSIPSTIVLAADGAVAAVYLGAVSTDELRSAIDTLLAEG